MEDNSKIVTLQLRTPVSDKESARLARILEGSIADTEKIRLLLFLKGYPARDTAETLFEDIAFIKLYAGSIEKMAVVGDRVWQDTWIAIFGIFGRLDAAYFDRSDREKAEMWLRR